MATGRVIKFDWAQGYGFIAPDDGTEDVFLHASVMGDDLKDVVQAGTWVRFVPLRGDRGVKATEVRLLDPVAEADGAWPTAGDDDADGGGRHRGAGEPVTDVALSIEVTELLLDAVPTLSGHQLLDVRRAVVTLADKHGWLGP